MQSARPRPAFGSRISLALLIGLATALPVAAQTRGGDPKAPEKPVTERPATPSSTATPQTPTTGSTDPNARNAPNARPAGDATSLAVAGLTRANIAATKLALEGVAHPAFRCPSCNMTRAEKGNCPMCAKTLVAESNSALRDILLDPDQGTIGFGLVPGQTVRLSEIEAALASQRVSIPADKLTVAPNSTLIVNGVTTQDAVKKLESELQHSKLFDSVTGRLMGDNLPAELTVSGGSTPATRAQIEVALAKAGSQFKLTDIVWTSPVVTPSMPASSTPGGMSNG